MRKFVLALLLAGTPAVASSGAVMHRDPGCGCCEKWAAQVRKNLGLKNVILVDSPGMIDCPAVTGAVVKTR